LLVRGDAGEVRRVRRWGDGWPDGRWQRGEAMGHRLDCGQQAGGAGGAVGPRRPRLDMCRLPRGRAGRWQHGEATGAPPRPRIAGGRRAEPEGRSDHGGHDWTCVGSPRGCAGRWQHGEATRAAGGRRAEPEGRSDHGGCDWTCADSPVGARAGGSVARRRGHRLDRGQQVGGGHSRRGNQTTTP
jgi:hypothetical protein